jgi:hypothetical protein
LDFAFLLHQWFQQVAYSSSKADENLNLRSLNLRTMEFEEYLKQKKIEASTFKLAEKERYAEWEHAFSEMHVESFTAQKKFLINDTRRKYHLAES